VNRSWHVSFVGLAAIWGASFLFIKVAVEDGIPPVDVALGRVAIGAFVLALLVRRGMPRGWKLHGHLFVVALFMNAIPFVLFSYGEVHVSSVLAGIYNAATPLITMLVVLLVLPEERPTPRKLLGLLLGFGGVVVVLGPWQSLGGGELAGQLMCLGAAACYAIGSPYMRRYLAGRPESGPALAGSQLLWATLQLTIVSLLVWEAPSGGVSTEALLSVLALGALGSGLAYVLFFHIIRAQGATTATTVTYLIPLFSTVLGVIVLDEGLTWNQPVGALVVLFAVWFSSRSPAPVVAPAAASVHPNVRSAPVR
jgi:drug/metabolite transporter (DMT)-like permease